MMDFIFGFLPRFLGILTGVVAGSGGVKSGFVCVSILPEEEIFFSAICLNFKCGELVYR